MSAAKSETPIWRKKLVELVAVPSCRAGNAFCTTRTSSWKNSPTPRLRTNTSRHSSHTGLVGVSRDSASIPAAPITGPSTG